MPTQPGLRLRSVVLARAVRFCVLLARAVRFCGLLARAVRFCGLLPRAGLVLWPQAGLPGGAD